MDFVKINPEDLKENAVQIIGYDWMLITAGNLNKYNTMTASWGGMGLLWNKPVMFIFIRPQRYTYQFVEREDYFSCSFFTEEYRDALNFCGSASGRDYDKAKETGLHPIILGESVAFNESRIVINCKKVYYQDILPDNFLNENIMKHYPAKDYHRMFIGEITEVWTRE